MNTQLAKTATDTTSLARMGGNDWETMVAQADMLLKSGFLPESIKTPAQAVAIIMMGKELGVGPMQSLRQIAVIKGKPTCGAELMLCLIYRDHGDDAVKFTQSDERACTLSYKRRTWPERREFSFSMEDATRAQLVGKGGPWAQYPAAMLRARAISAVARMAFPDSIAGMYTPEEMGAAVAVDADGAVVLSDAPAPEAEARPEDTDEAYRSTLIHRCREAGIALGKDRLKPIAKGRKPEQLEVPALEALTDELEAAVEAMMAETDTADYTPGEEG